MNTDRLATLAVGALIGITLIAVLSVTGCFTLFLGGGFSVGYPGHWFLVVSDYGGNLWHETDYIGRTLWEW